VEGRGGRSDRRDHATERIGEKREGKKREEKAYPEGRGNTRVPKKASGEIAGQTFSEKTPDQGGGSRGGDRHKVAHYYKRVKANHFDGGLSGKAQIKKLHKKKSLTVEIDPDPGHQKVGGGR